MGFPTSISASMYSDLSFSRETLPAEAQQNEAGFSAQFATAIGGSDVAGATPGEFTRITNVREFPPIGTPPNIVNVPTYGQSSSQQIQGQSDAPTQEITLNYVPSDWAATGLGKFVGDGNQYLFRFTLLNAEPTGTDATKWASTTGGLGTRKNAVFYFIGKIEALVVNPQLTDATTATLTLSIQSKTWGAYTLGA